MQSKKELEEYLNNSLINKLVESKIPVACKLKPCILGIDEAGRGPVLGPMSYAVAYFPQADEEVLTRMKFADSKVLSESTREQLFEALQIQSGGFQDIGFMIKIIAPNMISNSMLRRNKYNLNALSHDTAIDLIKTVVARGIQIVHVYIDTVGPPSTYKQKLQRFFPKAHFTVTEKADSKYPIVSAASVCAKVMRDRIVQQWRYIEADSLYLSTFELGSGYPADPDTKKYLENCIDPVFGFPTLARFSWSTITKALEKGACKCDWNEPDDDSVNQKELTKQQEYFKNFVKKKNSASKPSASFNSPKTKASPRTKSRTTADVFFGDRLLSRIMTWNI